MEDLSDRIEEGHGSCLCPLCDDEISVFDVSVIVEAHGALYLIHKNCIHDVAEEEEDEENTDAV